MPRRLLHLLGCLLLLLSLSASPTTSAQTATPTPSTSSTAESCFISTAELNTDHYRILWPETWKTAAGSKYELTGNFQNARYRVLDRQGNDTVYLWVLISSGTYQRIDNTPSQGDAWQTISIATNSVQFVTTAFQGAKTFTLEFCAPGMPAIPSAPDISICKYNIPTMVETDQWGGHNIAAWPEEWPYDRSNRRVLYGDYQYAKYRVTNYQGASRDGLRLWIGMNGNFKGVPIPDSEWHTIYEPTQSILFTSHIPEPSYGAPFNLDICFMYKKIPGSDRYDITHTPEGSSAMRVSLAMWGSAGIDTSNMKLDEYEIITPEQPTGNPNDIKDTLVKPKVFIQRESFSLIQDNVIDYGTGIKHSIHGLIGEIFTVKFPIDGLVPLSDKSLCERRDIKGYGSSNQCIRFKKEEMPEYDAIAYSVEHWMPASARAPYNLDSVIAKSRPIFGAGFPTELDLSRGAIFSPNSDSTDSQSCWNAGFTAGVGGPGGNSPGTASFEGQFSWQICPKYTIDYATYANGFIMKWERTSAFTSIVGETKNAAYMYALILRNASMHKQNQTQLGFEFYGAFELSGDRYGQ